MALHSTLLRSLYGQALDGLPILGTPADVAGRFADHTDDSAAERMTVLYSGVNGAVGFACGSPGLLFMPITLPADLVGNAVVQLHMAAAFAVVGGHDPAEESVRDQCVACLLERTTEPGLNSEDEEVAKRTGVKLAERAVSFAIERATRYAVKTGSKAALRKMGIRRVPFVGGFIAAGTDIYTTQTIAQNAQRAFLS